MNTPQLETWNFPSDVAVNVQNNGGSTWRYNEYIGLEQKGQWIEATCICKIHFEQSKPILKLLDLGANPYFVDKICIAARIPRSVELCCQSCDR